MTDLESLEKLLAEATRGPVACRHLGDGDGYFIGEHEVTFPDGVRVTGIYGEEARLIVALRNAAPALLRDARMLGKAWGSAGRMHAALGGVAPWDGGPPLFEMNEIALDNLKRKHAAELATAEREALERAAKVCEERFAEHPNYRVAGNELAREIRALAGGGGR